MGLQSANSKSPTIGHAAVPTAVPGLGHRRVRALGAEESVRANVAA